MVRDIIKRGLCCDVDGLKEFKRPKFGIDLLGLELLVELLRTSFVEFAQLRLDFLKRDKRCIGGAEIEDVEPRAQRIGKQLVQADEQSA